ncbi:hypothetical protein GRC12_44130, partial [Streptomyces griseorubiginosus]|nr:hypothetical protein [Streptomyces griseorubiginosus]
MVSPPEGGDRDAVEVLGADRPLLRDRWRALPRRVRWTATAATGAAVFTALLGYLAAHRPPPPPPH